MCMSAQEVKTNCGHLPNGCRADPGGSTLFLACPTLNQIQVLFILQVILLCDITPFAQNPKKMGGGIAYLEYLSPNLFHKAPVSVKALPLL